MRSGFVLAALVAVCIASSAQAQTVGVPRTYSIPRPPTVEVPAPFAIPLPPTTEPNWELGARYRRSQGKTGFNFYVAKVRTPSRQSHVEIDL